MILSKGTQPNSDYLANRKSNHQHQATSTTQVGKHHPIPQPFNHQAFSLSGTTMGRPSARTLTEGWSSSRCGTSLAITKWGWHTKNLGRIPCRFHIGESLWQRFSLANAESRLGLLFFLWITFMVKHAKKPKVHHNIRHN